MAEHTHMHPSELSPVTAGRTSTPHDGGTGATRKFQPGAVAGHNATLWILDASQPMLVRRTPDGASTVVRVPGPPRRSVVGWTPRRLHADASGCWIVGADGIVHCDHDGSVDVLDDTPIAESALVHGILATVGQGRRDRDGSPLLDLRTRTEMVAAVPLPSEIDAIGAAGDGFTVFMRTGAQGRSIAQNERGPWCARIGLDGTRKLGTAWPRLYWQIDRAAITDVGAPLVVTRQLPSYVLDEELLPTYAVPFVSDSGVWPGQSGPWLVTRPSDLTYRTGDASFTDGIDPHAKSYTYYRLDRHLRKPRTWCTATGFTIGVAETTETGQLWVSTTDGLFATAPNTLEQAGRLPFAEVDTAAIDLPVLPVTPPPGMGDPDVWALAERARLLEENTSLGMLDVEIDGWFPTATIIVTFTVRGLPGRVCARRYPLFNRDGGPALWRGAPTLMESILLGIDESGGLARLERTEPGAFGWTWV